MARPSMAASMEGLLASASSMRYLHQAADGLDSLCIALDGDIRRRRLESCRQNNYRHQWQRLWHKLGRRHIRGRRGLHAGWRGAGHLQLSERIIAWDECGP